MVAVLNSLIEIDENGVPWISGANTKVIEVVLDKIAHGWSPEEMHRQHSHLSNGPDSRGACILLRTPDRTRRQNRERLGRSRRACRQPARLSIAAKTPSIKA